MTAKGFCFVPSQKVKTFPESGALEANKGDRGLGGRQFKGGVIS